MKRNYLYNIIEAVFGIFAGAFIGAWINILIDEPIKINALTNFNNSIFLIVGSVLVVIICLVGKRETKKISNTKTDIITNSLSAYCTMYFNNISNIDYQICAMILFNKKNTVRTPYYINEGCNPAIRRHRPADFSDIGELFARKKDRVCKTITYNDWLNADEFYKSEVPNSLRCIIAVPVYSTQEADSSKILGVLEFDIFAQREDCEIDEKLFKSLTEWEKIESLREYSNSLAHMLEL